MALKMTKRPVERLLETCDVCFLSETWLHDGEEDMVGLPAGYDLFSRNRPGTATRSVGNGGVAFVVSASLRATVLEVPLHPDILVITFGDVVLVGAYVCPSTSKWEKWSDRSPEVALAETLAYVYLAAPGLRIIVLGDFNARIANKPDVPTWPRCSADTNTNSRALWLLDILTDYNLRILNGSKVEKAAPGAFTCHQTGGQSVVDLILWPADNVLTLKEKSFVVVEPPAGWSDHSMTRVTFEVVIHAAPVPLRLCVVPLAAREDASLALTRPQWYPTFTRVDAMAREAVDSQLSASDCLARAYGGVTSAAEGSRVVMLAVYIKKDRHGARAGVFSLALGLDKDAPRRAWSLPQWACINDTAAILYAICWTVQDTTSQQKLIVYGPPAGMLQLIGKDLYRQVNTGYPASYGLCAESFVQSVYTRAGVLEIRSPRSVAQVALHREVRTHARECWRSVYAHIGPHNVPVAVVTSSCSLPFFGPYFAVRKVLVSLRTREAVGPISSAYPVMPLTGVSLKKTRGVVRTSLIETREKMLNAENSADWWKIVKNILSTKKRPTAVTPEQLRDSFYTRLNPISPTPAHFNLTLQQYYAGLAEAIPSRTHDETPAKLFSAPWSVAELARVKRKVEMRASGSARGVDAVSYSSVTLIPNDQLAALYNECFEKLDAPEKWLTTSLIGIQKRGKPNTDPESYRLIGLESCLLKVLTLLIDARLRQWSDSLGLVPPSQNGFKPKMRTHNNSFLLRLAIERARAVGKPLYVVFVDLSNAFPSTDVSTLWVKMRKAGAGGRMFDWLRMLYQRMTYKVSHDGKVTEAFKSLVGLLTGDSVSPMLWTIFFGDLEAALPTHAEDIILDGSSVCHIEQADDVALFSTSQDAVQDKLNAFLRWCSDNFMTLSATKTKAMIFGPLDARKPSLRAGTVAIEVVAFYKFVGVLFASTERDIFRKHYAEKASKVRQVMNTVFALEKHIGTLSVVDGIRLYKAQIDPHLTFGCEVAIDVSLPGLALLEREQVTFLRRLLGVSRLSPVAPLFTETGLMPIRFRRAILAVGYARYLARLPLEMLPSKAFQEATSMRNNSTPGWIGDVEISLGNLGLEVTSLTRERLSNPASYAALVKSIYAACDDWLARLVRDNKRLWILQARALSPSAEARVRPYARVHILDYRLALTRLVMSQHRLAVEVLRRGDGQRRLPIPREWRLCRLCQHAVEDETHAVLCCIGDPRLSRARDAMWSKLEMRTDRPDDLMHRQEDPRRVLLALVGWDNAARWLGQLVHEVFTVFAEYPLYVPNRTLFLRWSNQMPIEDEVLDTSFG